jgi:hypothetical protein
MRRDPAFVACTPIGGKATNARFRPSGKGAGTHEEL